MSFSNSFINKLNILAVRFVCDDNKLKSHLPFKPVGLNCTLVQQVYHKHPEMTLSCEHSALNGEQLFCVCVSVVLHCASIFRLPVVDSPKQRQQFSAGTTPPPPSTCNKYFPSGLSPVNTIK